MSAERFVTGCFMALFGLLIVFCFYGCTVGMKHESEMRDRCTSVGGDIMRTGKYGSVSMCLLSNGRILDVDDASYESAATRLMEASK